jgi:hypothetical protein
MAAAAYFLVPSLLLLPGVPGPLGWVLGHRILKITEQKPKN